MSPGSNSGLTSTSRHDLTFTREVAERRWPAPSRREINERSCRRGICLPPSVASQRMTEVIDPRYLPYTTDELLSHMPPVGARDETRADRWLSHFLDSSTRYREFLVQHPDRRGVPISAAQRAAQVEKDERFWVAAAFMALVRSVEPTRSLVDLLTDTYGAVPPVAGVTGWEELVRGRLQLYFEASLPSPLSFRRALGARVDEHPVEYVRQAARRRLSDEVRSSLESATQVDALLLNPDTGFGLVVEAKVLSDVSSLVTFDATRNQIARNVDVMLETNESLPAPLSARRPERSFFLLLTPQLFKDNPRSRLYGWLMNDYQSNPASLAKDLTHRGASVHGVDLRIGWTTWDRMAQLVPGSCPWLTRAP